MTASSFLATPVYTIAAGKSRKEFPVHSGLLSTNSDKLRILLETDWKDNPNRTIVWTQWDESTVARFVQWLYTREYTAPDPKLAAPKHRRLSGLDTRRPHALSAATPPATPSPPSSVLSDNAASTSPARTRPSTPTTDTPAGLDYSEPFLAHAKLFALAQHTGTHALQIQCINLLAAKLDSIRYLERGSVAADNFVELARYVYRHTTAPSSKDESLRRVISSFAAFNFERLDCSAMMSLMAEGGEFVVDVTKKVMKTMRKPAVINANSSSPPPSPPGTPAKRMVMEAVAKLATNHTLDRKQSMAKIANAATLERKQSSARLPQGPQLKNPDIMVTSPTLATHLTPRRRAQSETVKPATVAPSPTKQPPVRNAVSRLSQSSSSTLERKSSVARLQRGAALEKKPSSSRLKF